MQGADVFAGVSVGGVVTREMVAAIAARPIIFAMANPGQSYVILFPATDKSRSG